MLELAVLNSQFIAQFISARERQVRATLWKRGRVPEKSDKLDKLLESCLSSLLRVGVSM